MRRSLALLACAALMACRRSSSPPPHAPAPQISGTIAVEGLTSSVRVVRDRWGVPHIYAGNTSDLFFAQGFAQAQDRLFQMDLWRRASLGRLSEILGVNFADRDAMTRRIQYRGDPASEWASYGPDATAIANAFVRGVNAWVSVAREHLPEDFALAGWTPAYWAADDLLNRTDAFLDDRDRILNDIARRGLPDVVRDAVRLVGTPAFLVGPSPSEMLIAVHAVSRATATPASVAAADARRTLFAPSPRYFVHLVAPGWNVAGATSPWLPGVAMGHNDRLAWGLAPLDVEPPRIVVEDANAIVTGLTEYIRVKGRVTMVSFTREVTNDGLVVASDREHDRAFVLPWRGFREGQASELAATAIDRAGTPAELRDALARWKTPARRFMYADTIGGFGAINVGSRVLLDPSSSGNHIVDPIVSGATADRDRALFAHLLGVTRAGRDRFDVGPVARPADDSQVQLTLDAHAWDSSRFVNAPGQSGSPSSTHYSDGAARWARGEAVELWFSDDAVARNAEATLTLMPRSPQP